MFSKMIVRALILVTVALAVAACGTSKREAKPQTQTHTQTQTRPSGGAHACRLTKTQRHAVALALADIRRLRAIQAPLKKFSERGTPAQEQVTGKFLLDVGRGNLPIDTRARLLHLAKAAVGLCGLCFEGIESAEPVLATKANGEQRCG